jgi:hypothetical protein
MVQQNGVAAATQQMSWWHVAHLICARSAPSTRTYRYIRDPIMPLLDSTSGTEQAAFRGLAPVLVHGDA